MKLYKSPLSLRDYQKHVRDQMDLATENSIICQPTGTGKTRIMVDYLMTMIDEGHTIAVIVPKKELIENIEKDVKAVSPELIKFLYSPISSGMTYKPFKRLYIATAGSFMTKYKTMRKKPTIFLYDEAHHSKAKTWEDITKLTGLHFGFTATPIRLDGRSLADLFPGFIDTGKNERWFIDNKYLCDFEIKTTFEVDFDQPKGFDNLGFQASVFDKKELIGNAVEEWKKYALGQKTVVFTTGNQHSEHVLEAYTSAGIPAVVVNGKMPYAQRKAALDGFKRGQYLILINTAIVTEGVDIPDAVCCQLLRFTQSISLYKQMIGRVLRYQPGKKAIILDHAGNVEFHLAPDALIDWREIYYAKNFDLEGLKNGSKPVVCELCNAVIYAKITDQPYNLEGVKCGNCGHYNYLKVRKARDMIETVSGNLKDFKLNQHEQSIYKIVCQDHPKQKKKENILKLLHLKVPEKEILRGLTALYNSHNNPEMIAGFEKEIEDFKSVGLIKKRFFIGDR